MKLKDIIKNLLCIIGIHDWSIDTNIVNGYIRRTCNNCPRSQRGSYDMMYGTTNWE